MHYLTDDAEIRIGDPKQPTYVEEGSVILTSAEATWFAMNVLPVYRDAMHSNAEQMRQQAIAIRSSTPAEPTPGHIDITPNPRGLEGIAGEFDRYVNRAQEAMAQLQGPE